MLQTVGTIVDLKRTIYGLHKEGETQKVLA